MQKLLYLNEADVRRCLGVADAIEIMHDAFAELSSHGNQIPQRVGIMPGRGNDIVLYMPAHSANSRVFGQKMVSVFHGNAARKLPTTQALMSLMDGDTGTPLAVMRAEYLTAVRTAAATGVATRLLSREDSRCLAIFGAGTQGRAQFDAVAAVRNISTCIVFDTDRDAAEKFARELDGKGVSPIIAEGQEALREADIVCTATNSATPVFEDVFLAKGTHINAVGSYTPGMSEVPVETVGRSKIFVDKREAALAEAGDITKAIATGTISKDDIAAELGEVVSGSKPGRESEKTITLFKSVGNAIQDVVAASYVYNAARKLGLGIELD